MSRRNTTWTDEEIETLKEKAATLKALADYQETVVPIFLKALARDRNPDLKFFIKL